MADDLPPHQPPAEASVSGHAALAQLRAYIADRAFKPGERLPPERVLCIEKVNARSLTATELMEAHGLADKVEGQFGSEFDLVVGDLSFISQTLVLPAVVPLLKPGGSMLMLVKPQFELQPGQVGKGGIVTDPSMYTVVEERVRAAHTSLGLKVQAWFESPVKGGDGNREFFIYSSK